MENKCNGSLTFLIHSFPFIECVPNNENISVCDAITFICILCLNAKLFEEGLKWIVKGKQIDNNTNNLIYLISEIKYYFAQNNIIKAKGICNEMRM